MTEEEKVAAIEKVVDHFCDESAPIEDWYHKNMRIPGANLREVYTVYKAKVAVVKQKYLDAVAAIEKKYKEQNMPVPFPSNIGTVMNIDEDGSITESNKDVKAENTATAFIRKVVDGRVVDVPIDIKIEKNDSPPFDTDTTTKPFTPTTADVCQAAEELLKARGFTAIDEDLWLYSFPNKQEEIWIHKTTVEHDNVVYSALFEDETTEFLHSPEKLIEALRIFGADND